MGTVGSSPTGGGETAKDPSGWSTDTLKSYIERVVHESDRRYEQRFAAQEQAVHAALTSAATAVSTAERNAERWRDNANEWRAAMSDREKNFMSREQASSMFDSLEKQLGELQRNRAALEGRSGGLSQGWVWLVGLAGLVIAAISLITR